MYRLCYWAWSEQVLCYFDKYADCKKALEILKVKYPNSKIWMNKITTIGSIEEFYDMFNGEIPAYERHLINKVRSVR